MKSLCVVIKTGKKFVTVWGVRHVQTDVNGTVWIYTYNPIMGQLVFFVHHARIVETYISELPADTTDKEMKILQ